MQVGDLVKINATLYWYGDQPRHDLQKCLALVLELRDDLVSHGTADASTWATMGRWPHGARLMIEGVPYLIRLKEKDVEILNAGR